MREGEKELYTIHSHMPEYKRRIKESVQFIRESQGINGKWLVSYSSGKDSSTLLDIVAKNTNVKDILFGNYKETPKENLKLAEQMANRYNMNLHVIELPGAFDVYEIVGHFFVEAKTEEEKKWTRWMLKEYKKVLNTFTEENGFVGQFLGMRMKESAARRFALSKKKYLYQTQDRKTWTCAPLYRWSSKDIWAYLIQNNVPYLKIYDNEWQYMPNGERFGRERIRSEPTFLASETIWEKGGVGQFSKHFYPQLFQVIREKYGRDEL